MAKFILLFIMVLGFFSCQDKKPELESDGTSSYEISTENWPKKSDINAKAQSVIENWTEYDALEASFDAMYTVANRDDLSLIIDDIIEKQKALETSEYPVRLDKPEIKSRQKVFKTYMLKVKGDLFYRLDPRESVIQMIDAYNALRNRFNVIVNNTLDTRLLLEE
ncbi:MAG: hypothetical protein WA913_15815 [Pricia sp.]